MKKLIIFLILVSQILLIKADEVRTWKTSNVFQPLSVPDYIVTVSGTVYNLNARFGSGLQSYSGTNLATLINNIAESDRYVYLDDGTFTITSPLLFEHISNFKFIGSGYGKTIISYHATTSTNLECINLQGTLTDIEIAGMTIEQTDTNASVLANTEGLICTNGNAGDGGHSQFTNIWVHDCYLSVPYANINGVFMSISGATALCDGIKFERCELFRIGRCGIEIIQRNDAPRMGRLDFKDIEIDSTGLSGSYGIGISIGGEHEETNFEDIIVREWGLNQAIEIISGINVTCRTIKLYNTLYHVNGITVSGMSGTQLSSHVNISDCDIFLNDPDAPGTTNTYSLPFYIQRAEYVTIVGCNTTGNHIYMTDCEFVNVTGCNIQTLGSYAFSFNDSVQNSYIHGNIIDLSNYKFVPGAVVRFAGVNTYGNVFRDNRTIKGSASTIEYSTDGNEHDNIYEVSGSIARTASAGGVTLFPGGNFYTITSASADNIAFLPVASTALIGKPIKGTVGANGFELRVAAADATTVYLNGITTNVEAAIPANSSWEATMIDATHWILKAWDANGAVIAAIVPDAV